MDIHVLKEVKDGEFVGYLGRKDIRDCTREELISYILIREKQMAKTHQWHREALDTLKSF